MAELELDKNKFWRHYEAYCIQSKRSDLRATQQKNQRGEKLTNKDITLELLKAQCEAKFRKGELLPTGKYKLSDGTIINSDGSLKQVSKSKTKRGSKAEVKRSRSKSGASGSRASKSRSGASVSRSRSKSGASGSRASKTKRGSKAEVKRSRSKSGKGTILEQSSLNNNNWTKVSTGNHATKGNLPGFLDRMGMEAKIWARKKGLI